MSTGTKTREPSQLYLKVPLERRWRARGIRTILSVLMTRWKQHEQKPEWEWIVMPGGAVISYRELGDKNGRGEIRIARAESLDPEKREKWEHEVRTFCKGPGRSLRRQARIRVTARSGCGRSRTRTTRTRRPRGSSSSGAARSARGWPCAGTASSGRASS